MTKWLMSGKVRELLLSFAAGAALLLASLANFINHNAYPYFRGEVALVALGLLAVSAVMAPLYVGQRQWGRSLLEGLLVALFIDLNTESVALASVAGLVVGLLTLWRRYSLIGPMALIGAVILITTILGLGEKANWIQIDRNSSDFGAPPKKPAILHIILDEHTGIEGLRREDKQGEQLAEELRSFYLENQFVLYGGAYSQHFNTINAVPAILNYGARLAGNANKKGAQIGTTDHLHSLVKQGYRITFFQSDFAHYCEGEHFFECITYSSSSPRPTLIVPMPVQDRAQLLALKFLALSEIWDGTTDPWNFLASHVRQVGWQLPFRNIDSKASSSIGTLASLDALAARLSSAKSGDVYFAHLLFPHFPYAVSRDCAFLPWDEWVNLTGGAPVEVRRRAYNEQVRCSMRMMRRLLDAFSKSPAGRNAVVIVHGDHGSRITKRNPNASNFGKFSDADMIAGFSTIFAIRAPGLQAAYVPDRQPVSVLLRDFSASGFRSAPHPKPPPEHFVYLADSNWKPVRRVPLPSSWTEQSK